MALTEISEQSETTSDQFWEATQGSVEQAINGEISLDIKEIFQEAWILKEGVKGSFVAATALFWIFMGLSTFILKSIFNVQFDADDSVMGFVVNMVIDFALYPMLAGTFLMGIHRSLGKSVTYTMVFECYNFLMPIFLLATLGYIIVMIGFALLIIPGVYIAVCYSFAMPLLVDKKLGVWEALETSRKAVKNQWFKVFKLMALLGLIVGVSFLLLIPLIWTVPFAYIAYGIAFRNLFGVSSNLEQ